MGRRVSGPRRTHTSSACLKAWWGDAATQENDFGFDWLPRISGDHSNYQTILDMLDDKVEGYFLLGQNPAVGIGQRQAAARWRCRI